MVKLLSELTSGVPPVIFDNDAGGADGSGCEFSYNRSVKTPWERGYAPSYDNCCSCLFIA